jgi:hypothetical protein
MITMIEKEFYQIKGSNFGYFTIELNDGLNYFIDKDIVDNSDVINGYIIIENNNKERLLLDKKEAIIYESNKQKLNGIQSIIEGYQSGCNKTLSQYLLDNKDKLTEIFNIDKD